MKKSMRIIFLFAAVIAVLILFGCPATLVKEDVIKNILYAMEFYGTWKLTYTGGGESGSDSYTITNSTIFQDTEYYNGETGNTIGTLTMSITSFDQVNNHILVKVVSSTGDYAGYVGPGDNLYFTYAINDTGVAVLYMISNTISYPVPPINYGPYYKQ